ncbi:MAG: hypothetical protein HOC20_01805, partial [Chloroflexi bacterium]|nr:hypothetical protein [Chloroflexota bacterium]
EYSNIDFDDSDRDNDYIEDPALGGDAAHQGGRISGFIVPDQIPGETIAAKITCFVAEGDDCWDGDEFIFNGETLWDGTEGSGWENESLKDVWNSQSIGLAEDGVDIDTFEVAWDDTDSFGDPLLEPGDSFADIEMHTGVDSWNLIYIILSVRSETLTPGAMDYMLEF